MDPSVSASAAVANAVAAFSTQSDVQSGLAVAAIKSAEQAQVALLQLFSNAAVPPPPASSGRGQNLDMTA